jgi:hypothetical protein
MKKKPAARPIIKTTIRMPEALWKRVRLRSIQEGISAEVLTVAALRKFMKGKP